MLQRGQNAFASSGTATLYQILTARKLTFEQLFLALIDREELEYQLDTDEEPYTAPSQSRFDTPEFIIVAGDTLRRLQMMRGSRVAFQRRGYQKDVAEIAKVTSEMCYAACNSVYNNIDTANTNAERLARLPWTN